MGLEAVGLLPEKPQLRSELSWGAGAGSAGLTQGYSGPPSPRPPHAASRPAALWRASPLWQASPRRQARFSHRLSALGQGQPKGTRDDGSLRRVRWKPRRPRVECP